MSVTTRSVLNSYGKESTAEKFTKLLRGALGGRKISTKTDDRGKKIFKVAERALLGIFLVTVGLPYTLAAGIVLACSLPKKEKAIPPTSTTKAPDVSQSSNPNKKIDDAFRAEMTQALGGNDKVINLSLMEDWDGSFDPAQFSAPVMRGSQENGLPFLTLCYQPYDNSYFKGDLIRQTKEGWVLGGRGIYGELSFRENQILKGSDLEKHMLERLQRLMQGIPVGRVKRYERKGIEIGWDKGTIDTPTDSYLKGKELEDFMKLDCLSYEMDPSLPDTQLLLFDFKQLE